MITPRMIAALEDATSYDYGGYRSVPKFFGENLRVARKTEIANGL
jgi:hypothetical protein